MPQCRWTRKALKERFKEHYECHKWGWRKWEGQKNAQDDEKKRLEQEKEYQEHGIKTLKSEYLLRNMPDGFREQPCMNSRPEFPPFDSSGGVLLPDTRTGMDLASYTEVGPKPGSP